MPRKSNSEDWQELRKTAIKELGRVLVKTSALEFGVFTLSSGKVSPYYIDLRVLPSLPSAFKRAVDAYLMLIENSVHRDRFDAVCGVPTSGLTFATTVAYELGKPLIYVRRNERVHGTLKRIEGMLRPGSVVLVVDDLITSGASIMSAAEAVRSEGGMARDAVVLIDRMEGGRQNLQKKGIRLHSLARIDELVKTLWQMNVIEEQEKDAILKEVAKK